MKKKIIVQIQGGLGNQLFQYAAASAIARRRNAEVWIDNHFFLQPTPPSVDQRQYLLDALNIDANLVSESDAKELNDQFQETRLQKAIFRSLGAITKPSRPQLWTQSRQKVFGDPYISRRGIYMVGHWQNYKLFENIRSDLIEEVTPKEKPPKSVADILANIKSNIAISVHVRRGDYLNEDIQKIHGMLPLSYYSHLIERIILATPSAKIFYFSDDADWVRKNLAMSYPGTIVSYSEQAEKPYWDLYLMRACSIHLVANSTFSWWAAFLKNELTGNVYIPNDWLNRRNNSTTNLLVRGWSVV